MATQTTTKQHIAMPENGAWSQLDVLVLDDDQFDRMRIRRALKRLALNVKITEISSIEALVPAMDEQEFDLFMVDYSLPQASGLEALKLIKANPRHRFAATIMISGVHEAETAFKTSMSGGDEFVTKKDLDAPHLRDAVVHALATAQVRQGLRLGGSKTINMMPARAVDLPETAVDLRPDLSRLLRQIRFLRQFEDGLEPHKAESIRQLEVACQTLWETLEAYDKPPGAR